MNKLTLILISKKPILYFRFVFQNKFFNKLNKFDSLQEYFNNKKGIEIGGPSNMFKSTGLMPIYNIAATVDGCNFSETTTWEGVLKQGNNYHYQSNKTGF
jgi:hypothetical protein